jgi:hypothetical protein
MTHTVLNKNIKFLFKEKARNGGAKVRLQRQQQERFYISRDWEEWHCYVLFLKLLAEVSKGNGASFCW